MKSKKILLLLLFFLGVIKVNAAYLKDYTSKYVNPDGKEITFYITGDEYFRYAHDKNKNVLIKNDEGYYTYATIVDGKVVSTNNIYDSKNIPSKTIKVEDIDLSKNQNMFHNYEEKTKTKKEFSSNKKRSQKEGSIDNVLNYNNTIIFVRFKGESEFVTPTLINSLKGVLGTSNNDFSSLKSYVNKVTEGHVNTNYNILQVKNTNYYSYESDKTRAYLQAYSSTNTIGYNSVNEGDKRLVDILNDAVKSIPETQTSNVDANGDGVVDNIIFIVSGYKAGWNEPLWPHKWSLTASGIYGTYSGAKLDTYNLQFAEDGDMSDETSVFCHETMHSLGLPDLYRYSYDGNPVGIWDMMDENREGSYINTHIRNRYGYTKLASQSWSIEPTLITKSGTYELNLASTNDGIRTYKIETTDENQFIQLEYRGSSGDIYDSKLPYDGLLVSRINLNYSGNEGEDDSAQDEYYIYRPNEDQYRVGGGGDLQNAAIAPCAGLINCSNKRGNSSSVASLISGGYTLEDDTNTRLIVKNVEYVNNTRIKFSIFLNGESVYIENDEYTGIIGETYNINPVFVGSTLYVSYSSLDPSIASVDSSGDVELLSVGSTRIKARINGVDYYSTVTVLPAKIDYFNASLTNAETITLDYELSGLEVESYLIYRSIDEVNYDVIEQTTATHYVDDKFAFGNTYYYKIGYVYNGYTYQSDIIKVIDTLSYLPESTTINKSEVLSINSASIEFNKINDAYGYNILVSDNPIGPFNEFASTTNTKYTLEHLDAARNYYIKVASYKVTNNNKYESEYSNTVFINTREKLLEAPNILNVQAISINEVRINYEAKENASGYNIYVSNDNKEYSLLVSDNKELSYVHNNVEFGKTYYYKVSAILDNTYEGYRSNSKKVTVNAITPQNFNVKSNGYDSILISYDEIENASGYEIYYSQDNSSFKLLVTTSNTSYKHTKLKFNKVYYYKVRSYREVDGKKVYSNYTVVMNAKALTSAPNVTITQQDGGNVKLDFSSDKYANSYKVYLNNNLLITTSKKNYTIKNLELGSHITVKVVSYKDKTKGNETTVEYEVKLRSPKVSLDTKTNTLKIDGVDKAIFYDIYRCDDTCKLIAQTTNLSFQSDSIKNDKIYSYYVYAFNGEYSSDKSNYVSNIGLYGLDSVSVKSSNSNEVKFNVESLVDFDGYELQMSTKKSSGYKKVLDSATKEFKYSKTTLNKTYYFKVIPYNKIDGKKYYAKSSNVITYKQTLNKIDSIKLTNATSSSVKVTFDKVQGAKGYNLYYKIGESGTFKKVSLSKNEYTLKNLNISDKIYFKVNSYTVVSKKTVTSPTSDIVSTVVKSPIPKYTISSLTPNAIRIDIDSNESNTYVIKYGTEENNLNKQVTTDNNTITINGLEFNAKYYFMVCERRNGVIGEGEIKSHNLNPVEPYIRYTRIDKNTVNLTWDNQGNNVFYEVYLQNNKIYEGKKTSLLQEKLVTGKEYTYRIRSYIVVSSEKYYSSFKELSVRCLFDRIDFFNTNVNSTLNKLNVNFDSVEGNVTHYLLLSTNSLSEPFTEIALSNTNSFSNVTVTPGKTYYLKVVAVVTYNNQEYYNEDSDYVVFKAIPYTTTSVTIKNDTYNSLKVSWSKVSDVSGYELYYSTKENSGYKKVTSTTNTSYVHKKLSVNKKYYYKVRTYKVINNKKYYSDYSIISNGTALPASPTNLKVSRYKNSATKNTISWKASSSVSGYYVYRSSDGSNYTYIGNTTDTKYNDKNAYYYGTYYKIKSYKTVSGKKYFSSLSDEIYMAEPLTPSFSILNSSERDPNSLYSVKIFTNKGILPVTILSSNAYMEDPSYPVFNRKMSLVNTDNAKTISKVVVNPGEGKMFGFKFTSSTWIDSTSRYYFYILYDDVKYKVMTSYQTGTYYVLA